jgi:hypothetical protein
LVGDLFGLVEGLGFVAEGDDANDCDAEGAGFGGITWDWRVNVLGQPEQILNFTICRGENTDMRTFFIP